MRVLITGSRHFQNERQVRTWLLEQHLNQQPSGIEVAHGASRGGGVDSFVQAACDEYHIPVWIYPVRPDLDGRHRGAPLNRNKRMVRSFMPDLAVAFRAEGKSNGTDHCIAYAEQLGYRTMTIYEDLS